MKIIFYDDSCLLGTRVKKSKRKEKFLLDYILSPVLRKKDTPASSNAFTFRKRTREEGKGSKEEGGKMEKKGSVKKGGRAFGGIDVSSRWAGKKEGEEERGCKPGWLIRKACVHDVLERLAAVLHRTLTLRYRRLAATTLSRFGLSHLFRSTLSVRRLLKSLSRGPSPVKSSWRNVARKWRERPLRSLPFILSSSPFYHFFFFVMPDLRKKIVKRPLRREFSMNFWEFLSDLGLNFWEKILKETQDGRNYEFEFFRLWNIPETQSIFFSFICRFNRHRSYLTHVQLF